jgi:hypothetical protein
MALQVIEFFGYTPLDLAAAGYVAARRCPFVNSICIKPNHGACSVRQVSEAEPVICCPNRMYGDNFKILTEIAAEALGAGTVLIRPAYVADAHLLAPKLRTLSPHDTAAAARRNDGWNAQERVPIVGFGKASLNRRVRGHEIPIPDAVA